MTHEFDDQIEQIVAADGPFAAVTRAGNDLAGNIHYLDEICCRINSSTGRRPGALDAKGAHRELIALFEAICEEEEDTQLAKDESVGRIDWLNLFAHQVVEVGAGIRRMNRLFSISPSLSYDLARANPHVASVGHFRARSYAELVADIGRDRYFSVYVSLDKWQALEWWNVMHSPEWGTLALSKPQVFAIASDAISALGVERSVDTDRIALELEKEWQRAEPDSGARYLGRAPLPPRRLTPMGRKFIARLQANGGPMTGAKLASALVTSEDSVRKCAASLRDLQLIENLRDGEGYRLTPRGAGV